jgi:hypothetical protein
MKSPVANDAWHRDQHHTRVTEVELFDDNVHSQPMITL